MGGPVPSYIPTQNSHHRGMQRGDAEQGVHSKTMDCTAGAEYRCEHLPIQAFRIIPSCSRRRQGLWDADSVFASVYTEKMLKQSTVSLWSRNVQLAFWSILTGGVALFMSGDGTKIIEGGLFQGYTPVVWLVVLLQGATGILVALVMKYADNIVKNFSVAMATVIATIASIPLFGTWPTTFFVIGMTLVFFSMWIYATNGATTSAAPPRVETDSESQKLLQDMESGHITHSEKSTND